MRTFRLHRTLDLSGLSGTGIVAEGVQFTDGTTVLRWLPVGAGKPNGIGPTTVVHDDIASVIALHGHNGATTVVFDPDVMGGGPA